jgi:hypothetical protein
MINDFIEYWAAAKLLLSGVNPYAPQELLEVQRSVGWSQSSPLIMWNPPWTFAFTAPLGLLDYATAQLLWFLLHAVIIFVGAQVLWRLYGGGAQQSRWAAIAALTFAPTYLVLLLGQIGALVLLGLILFLRCVKRRAWWLAGASLALVSIKPHLLYLFWLALLLWILRERRWDVAGGWAAGLLVAGAVPMILDGFVYFHYAQLIDSGRVIRPFDWATPSLGSALGELLAIPGNWIRWLPSVGGAIWLLWFWRRHSKAWDWISRLPIILVVSVATSSFVWTFDDIVLLPALVQCAVWLTEQRTGHVKGLIIAIYASLNAGILLSKFFVPNDLWYFWVGPIFLLGYFLVQSKVRAPSILTVLGRSP